MYSKYKIYLIFGAIFLMPMIFISCWCDCHTYDCCNPVSEKDTYFKIKVDNAYFIKDSVNVTDTLQLSLWGTIGTDSCYSFSSFQATKSTGQTDLILWGVHKEINSYGQVQKCESGNILLNGMIYRIYPLTHGNYTVAIHQPDSTQLVKLAYVR